MAVIGSPVALTITTANPGAIAITVPTGALGVIVQFRANYDSSNFSLTSSFSGTFTSVTPTSGFTVRTFYAAVTSTGSQTITPDFGTYLAEGPVFFVTFVDSVDTSGTWIRDAECEETSSITVNSSTTDTVIAMDNWSTGSAAIPPNETGWTSLVTQAQGNLGARLRVANSPGASTTTATAQTGAGGAFSGLSVVSVITAAGGTTHATTGVLTGQGSTVAGSAARTRAHPSSGALTGPGSSVVGSAARTRAHPTSGVLTGQGSSVAGSAARTRIHPTSGALTGPGSVVDGAAARTRVHPSSGDLVGPGSSVVGSADHQSAAGTHDTTGALVGQGSEIAGSANRVPNHSTSGALVGQGSSVTGSAARFRAFATSGALTGQGSAIAGSAARVAGPVTHATTGALVGAGSVVDGVAARVGPAVTHDTTGDLVGPGSLISGNAKNGIARRHAGTRKKYIIKGQKYALTDYELALLIQQMLDEVKRPEVQVVTGKEVKQVSRRVWKKLRESLSSLEALTLEKVETVVESNVIEYDDEDDEELLMLL